MGCHITVAQAKAMGLHVPISGPTFHPCEVCGTPFRFFPGYTKRGPNHARCCSRKCAGELRRRSGKSAKLSRQCEKCGKPFEVYPSQARGTQGRFCSYECACGPPRDVNNGACPTCGRLIFSRHPQKYCSRQCAGLSDDNPRRVERPNAICAACGKQYQPGPGDMGVVCSRRCWAAIKTQRVPGSPHPKGKGGKRADLGNVYFRSRWEANWARYLNWLIQFGEVQSWAFEPETFEFKNIRRGTRFYTPDFRVVNKDGSVEYHEVKGWMTPESRTRLKRMAKYYPAVKIIVIDKAYYRDVAKKVSACIPGWERCPSHGA